jgi:hypothetical protein
MESAAGIGGAIGSFIRMMLVLLLSGQPSEKAADGPELKQYVDQQSLAYVEVDVTELRKSYRSLPDLEKALFIGRDQVKARTEAAAALAEMVRADAAVVAKTIAEVRSVGIWLLGFAGDMDGIRMLAVLDRGNAPDVLSSVLGKLAKGRAIKRREMGWMATTYLGKPVYGFRMSRDVCMWFAEDKGKIAVATDVMALQSFLLRSRALASSKPGRPARTAPPAIARAEVDPQAVLGGFLGLMDGHDWDEVAMVSSIFDFPAWKRVTVTLGMRGAEVTAEMEPASRLAKALKGPHEIPALASAIPDRCGLALIGAPRAATEIWEVVRSGFDKIGSMEGHPGAVAEFVQEFKEEIGLDLEKDVVGNLTEIGVIVPSLKRWDDLERKLVIVGRAKDAAKAKASISTLAAKIGDEEERFPRDVNGASVWSVEDVKFALSGQAIMCGPVGHDTSGFDAVLKQQVSSKRDLAKSLAKRYGDAGGIGVLNPSFAVKGRDVGLVTAGLSFRDSSLRLRVDYDIDKVAAALLDIAAGDMCGKYLQGIGVACNRYLNDYGKYPPSLDKLLKYLDNDQARLCCPLSKKRYVYGKGCAGKQVGTIQNRGQVILARDGGEGHPDGGCVVYLDGRTARLNKKEFGKLSQ